MEFSRQKFWSGFSISFTRGSSNPGIKPTSPAWQDSSPLRQRVNTRPYSFSLFFKRLKSSRGNYNNNNKKQNKTKQKNTELISDFLFLDPSEYVSYWAYFSLAPTDIHFAEMSYLSRQKSTYFSLTLLLSTYLSLLLTSKNER